MNYKRKKRVKVGKKIYNLESWVSIEVKRHRMEEDGEYQNCLIIHLPMTKEPYNSELYVTYDGVMENCLWYHLGVDREEIEAMFLAAECSDE